MLVRKTDPLPVECVARGYLSGSGWKDYQQQRDRLRHQRCRRACASPTGCPRPIFTPATKAESGHDENISEDQAGAIVGRDLIARLRALTLAIYGRGVGARRTRGIIIADTKFEFGIAERHA